MAASGKIFGIGLSKTGTSSLCRALRLLGYSVVDFDVGLHNVEQVDAATDTPVADAFEALDRRYPGSRFIYTVRERESWHRSCKEAWRYADATNFVKRAKSKGLDVPELFTRLYEGVSYDRAAFDRAYDRHDRRVRSYFSGRPRDLLVMNISSGEGWQKLCPFLGREIPDAPFPRANTGKTRTRFYLKMVWRYFRLLFRPRKLYREVSGRF
jgi:hypothetical protein